MKAPVLVDEHPWHGGPGSSLQLTAFASIAELIADIIPTVPNSATMTTIAKILVVVDFICESSLVTSSYLTKSRNYPSISRYTEKPA